DQVTGGRDRNKLRGAFHHAEDRRLRHRRQPGERAPAPARPSSYSASYWGTIRSAENVRAFSIAAARIAAWRVGSRSSSTARGALASAHPTGSRGSFTPAPTT